MVGSALAVEVWPSGSPAAESNPSVPLNSTAGIVVFSIRNDTGATLTITGFAAGQESGCTQIAAPQPLTGAYNVAIAAGSQAQFYASLTAGTSSASDVSCTFTMQSPSSTGGTTTVPISFHTSATATMDVQPTLMNFGTQGGSSTETQTLVISNFGTAQTVYLDIDGAGSSNFAMTGCGGTQSCSVTVPATSATTSVGVQCTAAFDGPSTATLHVYTGGMMASGAMLAPVPGIVPIGATEVAAVQLACTGQGSGTLSLDPDPLPIVGPTGAVASAVITVSGSGSADMASITNAPQFNIQGCGSSCFLGSMLPFTLTVECTPGSGTDTAQLTVTHAQGTSDTALVTCSPSNTTGQLFVSSSPIDFGSIAVGMMGSASLTVTNTGGSQLTGVTLTFPGTNGEHYYADDCTPASPCTLDAGSGGGSGGMVRTVTLWFKPLVHGPLPSYVEATSTEDTRQQNVSVTGTGLGGVMVVTAPDATTVPPYHLDLGTIPINQATTGTITLRNDGNALYTATVAGMSAPYTIDMATQGVVQQSSTDFTVTCQSATPSAPNTQTWSISSDAYAGGSASVSVSCSIADTNVVVDPLSFDFGEVRVGSPAQQKTVTITNQGSAAGPALIKSMQLHSARAGLSLSPPTTTNYTLDIGQSTSATLTLATGSDTDLTGELLDIDVDNANLALPVRGKVVTPHSRVVPARLDLGTACVGTQVSGTVMLINDGTATLRVERPQMSDGFVVATPSSVFPLALPAGMSTSADVSPAVSASGAIEGTLTWEDDVPTVHEVPVELEYVSTGTALSPRALDFGVVAVDGPGGTQRVIVENCDPDPAMVAVKTLRGVRGPIGAWIVEPRVGYSKLLGAHEQQAVNVTFKPPARGMFEAQLLVTTRAGTQTVLLVGEATGKDFDETSFYTCGCTTPGVPWAGWPVPAAFVLLVIRGRRRRGSSSPR